MEDESRRKARQNRVTIAIVIVAVLAALSLCAAFLLFGYYIFSDVGLDPPPTATP